MRKCYRNVIHENSSNFKVNLGKVNFLEENTGNSNHYLSSFTPNLISLEKRVLITVIRALPHSYSVSGCWGCSSIWYQNLLLKIRF